MGHCNRTSKIKGYSSTAGKMLLVYPITTRIIAKATNPMRAARGIVRIHAIAIVRATPHFTALVPIVVPTPMIDVQMICVVLTGIPNAECSEDRCRSCCFCSKSVHRAEFGNLRAHCLDNTPSPGQSAECDCSMGNQDHPQRHREVVGIDTGSKISY